MEEWSRKVELEDILEERYDGSGRKERNKQ